MKASPHASLSSYLSSRSCLKLGYFFRSSIAERNKRALGLLRYAIRNFSHCAALSSIIDELVQEDGPWGDGERRWSNNLTLLLAARALAEIEGYTITRLEHPKGFWIRSPRAVEGASRLGSSVKSCDIEGAKGTSVYFEVKDMSLEIKQRAPLADGEISRAFGISRDQAAALSIRDRPHWIEPARDEQIRKWIEEKVGEANEKGADYLIARVPAWLTATDDYDYEWRKGEWLDELFSIEKQLTSNHFAVKFRQPLPTGIRGVYFVRKCGLILATPV